MIEISPELAPLFAISTGTLVVVLVAMIFLRPWIFTSYLRHMTGVRLSPRLVGRVHASRGPAGVRELFLDLLIREDLRSGPVLTPDSRPDHEVVTPEITT